MCAAPAFDLADAARVGDSRKLLADSSIVWVGVHAVPEAPAQDPSAGV